MSFFSPVILFLFGIALIFITGLSAFVFNKRASIFAASYGVVLGSLICLLPAAQVLLTGNKTSFRTDWPLISASFYVEIDAISAFFLICIFVLSSAAAIYGSKYILEYKHKPLSSVLFFFNVLVAAMAMVVVARNAILFLIVWEIMSLASFFLVTFEDQHKEVQQAGWTYLIATHIGTAFLLVMFAMFANYCGSTDFDKFAAAKTIVPTTASILFVLSVIGFGTKAGLVPFHIWLPEAHPAAPSHVSALMSGVMIKTGIYGIIRILTFLPTPLGWWGWLLIGIGSVSGVLGVLLALAQHDLKRLLAYHSVENIGIITMGMGLGVLGITYGSNTLAVAGFAGAILHVLNHSLFKGLLFLGTVL